MKITFLGTGAADWNLFEHKHLDGFRRKSAILLDDCLLIDPSPDVPDALNTFGKNKDSIKYVINSHKHSDHYSENTLNYLTEAHFYPLSAGESKTIGEYSIEVLAANHSTAENPVHFIISDGKARIFYGLDGAWLLYNEVNAIKKNGIDLAIIDATVGYIKGDYRIFEHNNLNMVLEIKDSLQKYVKRWLISHMARTLHTSHNELVESMKPHGIEVAFDGYEIEI